jgi:anti-anti-sigma factor
MLRIEKKEDGRCIILVLNGELSFDTTDQLKRYADDSRTHDGRHLVLDLAGLDFVDSSGAACLLRLRTDSGGKGGGETVLASVPQDIHSTLMRLGIVNNYRIFSSAADAALKLR